MVKLSGIFLNIHKQVSVTTAEVGNEFMLKICAIFHIKGTEKACITYENWFNRKHCFGNKRNIIRLRFLSQCRISMLAGLLAQICSSKTNLTTNEIIFVVLFVSAVAWQYWYQCLKCSWAGLLFTFFKYLFYTVQIYSLISLIKDIVYSVFISMFYFISVSTL